VARQTDLAISHAVVNGLEWVLVSSNQKREVHWLRRKYELHPLDLKAVMPPLQRPQLVEREEYLFLTLLYPVFHPKTKTIYASEVDFIVTPDRLITVNADGLEPLKTLFEAFQKTTSEKKKVNEVFHSGSAFRLCASILTSLEEGIFPMLVHLSSDIDTIETRLFRDYEKNLIQELLRIKTNVVNVRKAIQAHKTVLRQFVRTADDRYGLGKLLPYFDRLIDQTKEVWDALDVQKDTINALHETNASLIDFRINEIMKTLTIFSVIVFPLTLLAAIFGMNTSSMPFVDHPHGFWIIIGLMLLSTLGMLAFFKKKKWL
jgi:magnesium transporter